MKKLSVILAVILILLVGGYTALWYSQAQKAQAQLEQMLASLNAASPIFTYESMEKTGYPFLVGMKVHKPTFTMQVDEIFKPMGQAMPISPDGSESAELRKAFLGLPDWQEKITLDGYLTISVNAFDNSYDINAVGDYQGESTIADTVQIYNIHMGDGARQCEIDFDEAIYSKSFMNMWQWDVLKESPEKVIKHLTGFSCRFPEMEVVDATTKETLTKTAASYFYIKGNSKEGMVDFSFDIDMPSMSATKAYDSWAEHYYKVIYPEKSLPDFYKASLFGEQAFKFKGQVKMHDQQPQMHPILMHLEEAKMTSDLGNTSVELKVTFEPAGEMQGNGEVYYKLSTSANEEGYKMYVKQAEAAAEDFFYNQQMLPKDVEKMDLGTLKATFADIVPEMHKLGEVEQVIHIKGTADGTGKVKVSVEDIRMGAAPYGIDGKGALDIASVVFPIPTGELLLNCRSCTALVRDMTGWVMDFKPLVRMEEQDEDTKAFLKLDGKKFAEKLSSFLTQLGKADGENLSFQIAMTPQGAFTVNGQDAAKILMLYQQELAPFFEGEDQAVEAAPVEPVEEVTTQTAE